MVKASPSSPWYPGFPPSPPEIGPLMPEDYGLIDAAARAPLHLTNNRSMTRARRLARLGFLVEDGIHFTIGREGRRALQHLKT